MISEIKKEIPEIKQRDPQGTSLIVFRGMPDTYSF